VIGKKIAFFDFDGTITTKDTFLEMIKFQSGKLSFYLGFILYSPWLVAFKFKLIANDEVKQKILTYYFGGKPEKSFQETCDSFGEEKLPLLIRPAAILEIKRLRDEGFELVIVSASADNWLKKWCNSHNLKLVATKLEISNGIVTGRIEGKNCHGEEKVVRILQQWNLGNYREIYAYGDSSGDKPMLALATKSYYKPFRSE